MTYLQLINRVLTGLREGDNLVSASATEITDAYHLFIAELVNDFLEEVEQAHEWLALLTTTTYTHTADLTAVDIGLTANDRNKDVRILQRHVEGIGTQPMAYDFTDTSNIFNLYGMPVREMIDRQTTRNGQTSVAPEFVSLHVNSDKTISGRLWPVPDNNRDISLSLIIPQARLDPTVEADLDTEIKVPANTVALGAIWYGLAERGEELGVNPMIAHDRYIKSLADEVAADVAKEGDERFDMQVV